MRDRCRTLVVVVAIVVGAPAAARAECLPGGQLGVGVAVGGNADPDYLGGEVGGGVRLACHVQLAARLLYLEGVTTDLLGDSSEPDPFFLEVAPLVRLGGRWGRVGAAVGAGPALVVARIEDHAEVTAVLAADASAAWWFRVSRAGREAAVGIAATVGVNHRGHAWAAILRLELGLGSR